MRDYRREETRRRTREISLELMWREADVYEERFFVKVIEFGGDEFVLESDDLHEALMLLPEEKSQIIMFYYFYGMTDKEISQNLNLNRTTVRNRRYSALDTLKK